ncbi:basic phospholipase A2 trimucrotoxin-like [Pantherophis guttatus]|uniref:Basic phospholipase A2 trimucrotoxin-like n=1 Tax=Pantherophis guttatus TaxID=94885 RepID=A0A6P9CM47_PANGU|nr:basic phospholipase A2 trimucrotoxin-like [Pantherophis guttatus]
MVTQVTGKAAIPYYSTYGCYCGLGGRGRPKDGTDRCCQRHDCCYGRLEKWGCCPKTIHYSYRYYWGHILCGSDANWCQEETCSCDWALSLCLKQNAGRYQTKYTFYPNFLCWGPSPSCSL